MKVLSIAAVTEATSYGCSGKRVRQDILDQFVISLKTEEMEIRHIMGC